VDYWADRVRIHVPITTSPVIEFLCNDKSVHMPPGEAWIFDAWKLHNVLNPTGERRIHLVADTVGSAAFWQLVDQGERPFGSNGTGPLEARRVEHRPGAELSLETERSNYPVVMDPWEQRLLFESLLEDLPENGSPEHRQAFVAAIESFQKDWRGSWARYGRSREGWQTFDALRKRLDGRLASLEGRLSLTNNTDAVEIARQMLLRPALNPQLAAQP